MISIRSPQQLGDALRAARKQFGLTQPQLALAAGVGVRFIVELEAGKLILLFVFLLFFFYVFGGGGRVGGFPSSVVDDQHEGGNHGA